ncbi:MAG: hypothetical protein ABSA12_09975 [Verrucomicrobiia bacterium]|jgi:hypothetical protein
MKFSTCGVKVSVVALMVVAGVSFRSQAYEINFDSEGLTGPSLFADASPIPQTITVTVAAGLTATFSGGVILTDEAGLSPYDASSVYATTSLMSGMSNPMVITFSQSINNFYLDLWNGLTTATSYTITDNNGDSKTVTLAANDEGGNALVTFAAAGTQVDIYGLPADSTWDWSIDNIVFDEPLPGVPETSSTVTLLGASLLALRAFAGKKRR